MTGRLAAAGLAAARWLGASAARGGQNIASAFDQIWCNKGRSFLTTLGVIIAVTAIILVVTLVEGFGGYMTNMLRGYGTRYMVVRPCEQPGVISLSGLRVTLDEADFHAVREQCRTVRRLSPFVFAEAEVAYGRATAKNVPIRGVTGDYQVIRNYYADAGRFFGPIDLETNARVCVLGRSVLKLLECDDSIVGDHVKVHDTRFRVVGLLESKGSFMGDDQDLTVMIPYTTALAMFTDQREAFRFLAEAESEEKIEQAAGEISRVLRRRHGLQPGQPDDFEIQRQDQMLKEFEKVRLAVTGMLAGIVSISLLVGGIGIMNVMFVSVTERTREIGLRKSVGGRRRDILLQFLTEAMVLSTCGGAVGIVLGYLLTGLAAMHPKMVDAQVPAWSVALALVFSMGAGMLFGMIPAFKAAILHPIEALRHE